MKWNGMGHLPETLVPGLEKNIPALTSAMSKEEEPGSVAATCSFETGDQRYKYLEHAVYVGKQRMVVVPTEAGGSTVMYEVKISCVAA